MSAAPSQAGAKGEAWALSPQLGMPHLTNNPEGPQQALAPLWQGVNTAFLFAVHHILQLQASNINKVLSLLFNWVKYVMISKSCVCVCVCVHFLLQPSHMTKWLIPQQPLRVNADIVDESSMKIQESYRISIIRSLAGFPLIFHDSLENNLNVT